jgi:hypothetical protein
MHHTRPASHIAVPRPPQSKAEIVRYLVDRASTASAPPSDAPSSAQREAPDRRTPPHASAGSAECGAGSLSRVPRRGRRQAPHTAAVDEADAARPQDANTPTPGLGPVYRTSDAAAYLGVSRRTFERRIAPAVPSVPLGDAPTGGLRRWLRADLDAYLLARRRAPHVRHRASSLGDHA